MRKGKNTNYKREKLSEDRFLFSLKDKPRKKKEKERVGVTRDSSAYFEEGSEEDTIKMRRKSLYSRRSRSQSSRLIPYSSHLGDKEWDRNFKDTDDFTIIEDSKAETRIKEITVYASHYIVAIQVTYIERDLKETKVTHSSNNKYLNERPDLEKKTLTLQPEEYIYYLGYSISSQNGFIRSLEIETTSAQQLIIEGQIELNNMTNESGQDSSYSSLLGTNRVDQDEMRKSYNYNPLSLEGLNSQNRESIKNRSETPIQVTHKKNFNTKSTHKQSFANYKEKYRSIDFRKLKQRVIGFKTEF